MKNNALVVIIMSKLLINFRSDFYHNDIVISRRRTIDARLNENIDVSGASAVDAHPYSCQSCSHLQAECLCRASRSRLKPSADSRCLCGDSEKWPVTMLTSSNQYLRPEYLTPLPTTVSVFQSYYFCFETLEKLQRWKKHIQKVEVFIFLINSNCDIRDLKITAYLKEFLGIKHDINNTPDFRKDTEIFSCLCVLIFGFKVYFVLLFYSFK